MRHGAGHLLGYVSLCSGYINSSAIYQSLIQSEFISSSYLSEREVSLLGNGYTELQNNIYVLYKRTPRIYLFSIYPVEFKPKKEKVTFSSTKQDYFTWTGQTISFQPTSINIHAAHQYIMTNTAAQIQQIIVDDPLGPNAPEEEIDDN